MVEENTSTGARLEGELEYPKGECPTTIQQNLNPTAPEPKSSMAGDSGLVVTAPSGSSIGSGNATGTNATSGSVANNNNNAAEDTNDNRDEKVEKSEDPTARGTSSASGSNNNAAVSNQDDVSGEKTNCSSAESPNEKVNTSTESSGIDQTEGVGKRDPTNSLGCRSTGFGSVDSRSDSGASPEQGNPKRSPLSAPSSFLQRSSGERASFERFRRSGSRRTSLRSSKELSASENGECEKGDDLDDVDGDDEPPAPAPRSRPTSPTFVGDPIVASRLSNVHGGNTGSVEMARVRRLRLENERLVAEVARLRRLLLSGAARNEVGAEDAALEEEARFVALEMELQHAKEALKALKADRKRLKAEKFDLLNQMKALYGTLEDKERELRDFIRNYEQRMREDEGTLSRAAVQHRNPNGLAIEERERERERWSLLRAARDEADRSLSLAANLADKETALLHAHATIKDLQRQLAEKTGGDGASVYLSDQESLLSYPRGMGSINGASIGNTTRPGSSSGGLDGCVSQLNIPQNLTPSDLATSIGNISTNASAPAPVAGDRGSCSADSGVRGSSDRESGGATSIGGNLSDSTTDATTTPKDRSPTLSPLNAFSRPIDSTTVLCSMEQLPSPLDQGDPRPRSSKLPPPQQPPPPPPTSAIPTNRYSTASRGGGPWGSISRVFTRSRHRKGTNSSAGIIADGSASNISDSYDPYKSWFPASDEGYAEKLRLLREAASIPMERWRAPTVLAWLQVALGMPQYGPRCAENIKSGKILLELTDAELEAGLGITHQLHRKKLRLAIEEHRHPNLVRYPCIAQLGHTWVSSEWLPDLGLAQYSESFATNMVDARMLDHLTKKELEKLLGVTRKFHQASIVHGIHLLRMLNYDRQALAVRRHQCEQVDTDPLVWTNQRFIRWAQAINLTEYAENLKDSGVHGALVVLEPSFTGDTMATALGIPPAKSMIRRHLTVELEALVFPARGQLEVVPRNSSGASSANTLSIAGSFGRNNRIFHLQHHHSSASAQNYLRSGHNSAPGGSSSGGCGADKRRSSLRGSLSRAFGLKTKSEKTSPSSSSDTGSLTSQCQYMSSLRSDTPPPPQLPPRPIQQQQQQAGGGTPGMASNASSAGKKLFTPPMIITSPTMNNNTKRHHRRVKSIGDIEYMSNHSTVSTPV